MKTVQEKLREANKIKLIDAYFDKYPVRLDDFDDDISIGEARKHARQVISDYIDRLCNLKVEKTDDNKTWLFYVYHYAKDGIEELRSKGITAYQLFRKCPELQTSYWKQQGRHLWSPSYYVGSIGAVNEQAVAKYIDDQRKKEQ